MKTCSNLWKVSILVGLCTVMTTQFRAKVHGFTPNLAISPNETCEQYALRGGFADWPMGEKEMLQQDPTIRDRLIEYYEVTQNQPYWFLIVENWMACGLYNLCDGRSYSGWQVGDLNLDGIVNLSDLAVYSETRMKNTLNP